MARLQRSRLHNQFMKQATTTIVLEHQIELVKDQKQRREGFSVTLCSVCSIATPFAECLRGLSSEVATTVLQSYLDAIT